MRTFHDLLRIRKLISDEIKAAVAPVLSYKNWGNYRHCYKKNLAVSGVGRTVDQMRVGSTYCSVPIKLISLSLPFFLVQSNSNPITVKTLMQIASVIQLPSISRVVKWLQEHSFEPPSRVRVSALHLTLTLYARRNTKCPCSWQILL